MSEIVQSEAPFGVYLKRSSDEVQSEVSQFLCEHRWEDEGGQPDEAPSLSAA